MPWPTVRRHRRSSAAPRPPTPAACPTSSSATPICARWSPKPRGGPARQPQVGQRREPALQPRFFRTNSRRRYRMVNSPTWSAPSSPTSAPRASGHRGGSAVHRTSAGASRSTTPSSMRPSSRVRGIVEPQSGRRRNGNITVQPGNRLPGIPCISLKASAYYNVTDKWTVGATLLAASSQLSLRRRGKSNSAAAGLRHLGPARATSCCPTWNSSPGPEHH